MPAWLVDNWTAVWPNLEASLIWATPAFVAHHLLIRRHVDRRHEQLKEHLASQGAPTVETEA